MDSYTNNLPIINTDEKGNLVDYDFFKNVSIERLINFMDKYYKDFKYEYDYLEKIANEKEQ